ncbi:hypothetical protein FF125_15955 [Aureibaculum algae]|uniref:Lipoprotein n=1 Tax=Aureibaculum algae TaxID=2584122 RepID=A0A5B7TU51_9FLAO|nr:hypothetical protein [Aureibaculum algae]QCX39860.1 hypothetical protein FF125_15955 [Aureibaculum algae]
MRFFIKITVQLFLFFALISCSKNKYEKELLGTWNNYPSGGSVEIRFYKDSISSYEHRNKRKGTWSADISQIKMNLPLLKFVEGYKASFIFDYKLNGDSLFIKNLDDSAFTYPVFFKVNDYWKHYLRQFDFQIDLPVADFEMIKSDYMQYGIDLFVGYNNKELIVQYNDQNNNVLKNIKSIVYSERAQFEEEVNILYFNLIADKNVSEQQIDSIKKILNVFPDMKIFRVYKNDTANYGKYDLDHELSYDWSWYGRFE